MKSGTVDILEMKYKKFINTKNDATCQAPLPMEILQAR